MKDILGINYYFGEAERNDRVFDRANADHFTRGFVISFKDWFESHYDVEVHTWDAIDPSSNAVKAVLYFDYSWRYARQDPYLKQIPFQKRALSIIEPNNVNPSLYFIPFYRNRFHTIFTWDERLLERHSDYHAINVPVGAEPSKYASNPFAHVKFRDKKLLVAVSRNRWSYMPYSTYRKRVAAYRYFTEATPSDFDLYGSGWSKEEFPSYRGGIYEDWDSKVATLSKYRFALCFENNASQPGYISEKILDCFCARCVPIYYGSKGIEKRIPRDCFIDLRDFRDLDALRCAICSMTEEEHARHLLAIDCFLQSEACSFFSTEHYFTQLATGLGLRPLAPSC